MASTFLRTHGQGPARRNAQRFLRRSCTKKVEKQKVIILGAAGRDFHNFNCFFRDNPAYEVVAFTAEQIPGISNRTFPAFIAGKLYPKGIKIYSEEELPSLVKKFDVDEVILAYSDLSHQEVMEKAARALAAGADFKLMGIKHTFLRSKKPVVAICAVRTGAGKSPTTRKISLYLKQKGHKVGIIRHPMPYGNLRMQDVQRFQVLKDLDKQKCTFEEREEYEPHIRNGFIVYAGVDYGKVLRMAESESDIILWDGGNNDLPFIKPDFQITIADARRAGHETTYYPGLTNFMLADVIMINKIKSATQKDIQLIKENASKYNPKAKVVMADMSNVIADGFSESKLKGKKVLAIEDGPTTTHGGMSFGAAALVARSCGAQLIDPRPYAVGSIKQVFAKFKHLSNVLPAMGYGNKQISELQETINKANADYVLIGTPVDIRRILKINKPMLKVNYEVVEIGRPTLAELLDIFLRKRRKK